MPAMGGTTTAQRSWPRCEGCSGGARAPHRPAACTGPSPCPLPAPGPGCPPITNCLIPRLPPLFPQCLASSGFTDVWRHLHPDVCDVYSGEAVPASPSNPQLTRSLSLRTPRAAVSAAPPLPHKPSAPWAASPAAIVWDEKTSARAFNQGVRIDYALASPGLMPHVASCKFLGTQELPPKWSDHAGARGAQGGTGGGAANRRAPVRCVPLLPAWQ